MLIETNEVFDVILQPQGMEVIVGNPGTADVVIVDNDGEASVISKLLVVLPQILKCIICQNAMLAY